ncbi:hypothetical protein PV797_17585 [Clostridiaceae bacterium M8S5]|nr:hypothetical protein PV797_17585 [Clostridiaceae bacterium M8S5]
MKHYIKLFGIVCISVLMVLTFCSTWASCDVIDVKHSITIKASDCNIIVTESDTLKYDYNNNLFDVTTKKNDNSNDTIVTVNLKKDAKTSFIDKVKVYIPKNVSKVNIEGSNAGISLCKIYAPLDIINNNGAVSFYLPKDLSHSINYTSNKGSGSLSICKNADNYSLKLDKTTSALTVPFSDYKSVDSTYEHVTGNGHAQISINLTNSSFSINQEKKAK